VVGDTTSVGAGASASVPAFVEPLCANPRWTVTRRGARVGISSYCLQHATQAMFGDLDDELETPETRDPDAIFRDEVRRRRLEHESRS
jgi:hypothetical protein